MGAYLEFQELVLELIDQAELEAHTVHDYIDSEQLGRRWDLLLEHRYHPGQGEEIVTTLSVRLNSPLEVLLEEASALEWEPGEDLNLNPDADGEVEVEIRLRGLAGVTDAAALWEVLRGPLASTGAFDQLALVQEQRLGDGADEGDAPGPVARLRLAAYPEPQDFGRDAYWAAILQSLAETMALLHRQTPGLDRGTDGAGPTE